MSSPTPLQIRRSAQICVAIDNIVELTFDRYTDLWERGFKNISRQIVWQKTHKKSDAYNIEYLKQIRKLIDEVIQ